ncbi:uncharacterized protein LOC129244295 [Anastrepha obliqua]|uniref:uncharacterized protein LOC129244295 n=1 Tax=Anastrepha obliqua TaxID=95512 RepID=UPI0024094BAC|nr:uncharacterized protein LOC129244295 [Anastrepha obliqua]
MQKLMSHQLWWRGPEWLLRSEASWPQSALKNPETIIERKSVQSAIAQTTQIDWFILEQYSSLDKLLSVTAWCLRFSLAVRGKQHESSPMCLWPERVSALIFWVKYVQNIAFKKDVLAITKYSAVNKSSSLYKLHPILDSEGILRIGGRLANANIPFSERYPAILPKENHLTILIIRQAHQRTLHGGTQATLHYIRRQFWTQIMGDLPAGRCNVSLPFMHTGVDFAGPFNVKTTKGRGHTTYKGYVALFVCFATRAIHLELVSDLTTDTFLAALNRFVSVRGLCSDIYSDQGTTFVGANALMQQEVRAFKMQLQAAVTYSSKVGITWHFIPPGAPNFGGLWEAGVKSMKHHLKRVINLTPLTFEEFYTILKQVEACLNSRPMAAISDDPQDLTALTPGHFLVGRALTAIPEQNILDEKLGFLKRWKLLKQVQQDFWRRWSNEYLQQLQARRKWRTSQSNVRIGQLILIRNERLPPKHWALGRVVDTHAGADGAVRVVTIKTQSTTLKRPITKISVLPIDEQASVNMSMEDSSAQVSTLQTVGGKEK